MSVYHDMARDAGLHIGTDMSLDDAAAYLEEQEREDYFRWAAEQFAQQTQLAEQAYQRYSEEDLPDEDF